MGKREVEKKYGAVTTVFVWIALLLLSWAVAAAPWWGWLLWNALTD